MQCEGVCEQQVPVAAYQELMHHSLLAYLYYHGLITKDADPMAKSLARRVALPSSRTSRPCGVFSSVTTADFSRNALGKRMACELPDLNTLV